MTVPTTTIALSDSTTAQMSTLKLLTIVIVGWNSSSDIVNCLNSLYNCVPDAHCFEVILVDNASGDYTVSEIGTRFPNVRIIANSANVGFSVANNSAIDAATATYILLLNPDTMFVEDCISPVILLMNSDSSIGLVGCKLLNEDRTHQWSGDLFPDPLQEINPGFRARLARTRQKIHVAIDNRTTCEVGALIGAFQIVPRDLLVEIGMLDSSLFMYGEDLDLCYRIQKAGKRIIFDASVSIVHVGGRSASIVWSGLSRMKRVRKSIYIIHRKHFGAPLAFLSLAVRSVLGWLRCITLVARPTDRATRTAYLVEATANMSTLADVYFGRLNNE